MRSPNDHPARIEPLSEEARVALRCRGDSLLGELESMRKSEAGDIEIRALDPQAGLALRQNGDGLLADLAAQRAELVLPSSGEKRVSKRRRWLAIAAGLLGFAGASALLDTAFSPTQPPAPAVAVVPDAAQGGDPFGQPLATPAIPEPSSVLLTLAGAIVLLGRRRR
jgi:hypothetical protein